MKNGPSNTNENEKEVASLLLSLGFQPHLMGYRYALSAIQIIIRDASILSGITKHLYPMIAKRHSTTSSRVERAIRHSIEIAHSQQTEAITSPNWAQINCLDENKPTNGCFLATVAEVVRLRLNMVD